MTNPKLMWLALAVFSLTSVERASADVIGFVITVSALPTTITQCRDPDAYLSTGVDQGWGIFIDTDASYQTGAGPGYDVLISIDIPPISTPCAPTVVSTEQAYSAVLKRWNSNISSFENSYVQVTLAFDFANNKITVVVPEDGPLLGMSPNARAIVLAQASYTDVMGTSTLATDGTALFTYGSEQADPAADVEPCDANCSTTSDWYKMIDVTDVSSGAPNEIFYAGFE